MPMTGQARICSRSSADSFVLDRNRSASQSTCRTHLSLSNNCEGSHHALLDRNEMSSHLKAMINPHEPFRAWRRVSTWIRRPMTPQIV